MHKTQDHTDEVTGFCFLTNGREFLRVWIKQIRVWDVKQAKELFPIKMIFGKFNLKLESDKVR